VRRAILIKQKSENKRTALKRKEATEKCCKVLFVTREEAGKTLSKWWRREVLHF